MQHWHSQLWIQSNLNVHQQANRNVHAMDYYREVKIIKLDLHLSAGTSKSKQKGIGQKDNYSLKLLI